ncbi:hypothetical protein M8994_05605 [Brucella sp. 21LCYQ03]|nr:hypothetical protein [Brucella sp. 21LCYQ03]
MITDEQYLSDLSAIGDIAFELGCIEEYNYIVDIYNKIKNQPSRKAKPW